MTTSLEMATAQMFIHPDVNQMLEDYPMSIVCGAVFYYVGTVKETARLVDRAPTTVREHLDKLGIERKMGRPMSDHCKYGHDMAIHRRYSSGAWLCSECKRIRERKEDPK